MSTGSAAGATGVAHLRVDASRLGGYAVAVGELWGLEIVIMAQSPRREIGRKDVRAALAGRDGIGEGQYGRGTRSPAQSEQGGAPAHLMCAAKQAIGLVLELVAGWNFVREGSSDGGPQQQELQEEAGHPSRGWGGLSGTGSSGFAS